MLDAPKALLIVGADATDSVAFPVLPVPPSFEVTAPVVLFLTPTVVPVTFTTIVQVPLAGMVPPLYVNDVSPALGVNVPPHDVDAPGDAATCKPDGRPSVNATPVNCCVVFGLVIVNVNVVVPFSGILGTPNAFDIDGGATTVIEALAVLPAPPSVDVMLPVVLFLTPAVAPVTSTVTKQVPPAESIPEPNVSAVSPGLGANVPPQESLLLGVAATCSPDGSGSLNPIPVSAVEFGFVSVNIRVAVPPRGIVGSVAVAVPPPDAASPVAPSVYVNVVDVGAVAIVNVPLYPATPTPAITTVSPTAKP